jgi:hypothetical protein
VEIRNEQSASLPISTNRIAMFSPILEYTGGTGKAARKARQKHLTGQGWGTTESAGTSFPAGINQAIDSFSPAIMFMMSRISVSFSSGLDCATSSERAARQISLIHG